MRRLALLSPAVEGELAAVEERVSRLINLIEEKMPLYKQVNSRISSLATISFGILQQTVT